MIRALLALSGFGLIVIAAFFIAIPVGLAVAGCVLIFVAWASPKE